MAKPPFDPDAYLAATSAQAFDPDAYLAATQPKAARKPMQQIEVNGPKSGSEDMGVMETMGGQMMGALRGASRIGNTLLRPIQGDKTATIDQFFRENANPDDAAFKSGDIATQIAGTAGVGGAMGNTLKAVSSSPKVAAVADALANYGLGKRAQGVNYATRVAAGGAAGGVAGGLVDPEDALKSAGIGAALPFLAPVAKKGADFVGNVTGPMRESWRTSQGRNFIDEMLGDAKSKVIAAIAARGSGPSTVADDIAAANVGKTDKFGSPLVAIEGQLERLPGGLSDAAKSVNAKQEAERIAALRGVTPIVPVAEKVRETVTKPMYQAAEKSTKPIDISGVADKVDDILSRTVGNKELQASLGEIRAGLGKSAGNFGFGPSMTNANAEKLVSVIDGLKAQIANKDNAFIRKNLIALRDDLKGLVPGYRAADAEFARLSAPMNQAAVLDEMVAVLSGQGGPERITAFNNVLGRGEDALIKRAGGDPRFGGIDEVLTGPGQRAAKDKVSAELMREFEKRALAKNVDTKYLFDIAEKGKGSISIPNLLSRPAMVTNFLLKQVGQGADDMIAQDMAKLMITNPAAFSAKYLKDVQPTQRQLVMQQLMQKLTPVAGVASPVMATQGEQ